MASPSEAPLASLPVTTPAGRTCTLFLTPTRVFGRIDRGVFGVEDTSITLSALDGALCGWSRSAAVLTLGIILLVLLPALAGLGLWMGQPLLYAMAGVVLLGGVGLLLAFFLDRPSRLVLRAGTVELGGRPQDPTAAERFLDAVLLQQARLLAGAAIPAPGGGDPHGPQGESAAVATDRS